MKVQFINGFKSGEIVEYQGGIFYNLEEIRSEVTVSEFLYHPKTVKYRLMRIPNQKLTTDLFYVHELTSDFQAKKWVRDIEDAC